jgi:hypothetical protein
VLISTSILTIYVDTIHRQNERCDASDMSQAPVAAGDEETPAGLSSRGNRYFKKKIVIT